MSNQRLVHLFRNGRNQALRIPREFELDADQAIVQREGDHLVIYPLPRAGLLELLAGWEPEEDGIDEPEDKLAEPVEL